MEDLMMKAATVIAVALATFSSFPSPAQQQQQPVQQQDQQQAPSTTSPAPQSQPAADKSQPSAAVAQLKPVTGELVNKLDSKSAKEGDSVELKTKEDVKFSGGAEIPKGSKLVGHVTNVQARAGDKENSQIAIQFDQAELKDGQNVAIESVIQSVSPAPGSAMDNGSPVTDGTASASSSAPSGATASSPGTTGSNANMNQNAGNSRPESNTAAEPGATDQNTSAGMPAPGSMVARNGNIAIRTTAIPGVLIANNIDGLPFTNASGMLVGARRDIHLDSGTQMVLAVAGAPQGTGR